MWNVNERFEKKAIDSLARWASGRQHARRGPRGEIWLRAEFRQEPMGAFA